MALTVGAGPDREDLWKGTCAIVGGEVTHVQPRNGEPTDLMASLSDTIRCPGGLAKLQENPLVSICDNSGSRRVKVIDLIGVDNSGETFSFGPVSLSPGSYRVALAGLASGETLDLRPAQAEAIHWALPGIANVTFKFIDRRTGEQLTPQSISYWQDPSGLTPPQGLSTRMKHIGFPTMRSVKLPAGLTWFRFGLSLGRPIEIKPRELVPGDQVVAFHLGECPRITVTLLALNGMHPEGVPVPTFLWARRLGSDVGMPSASPWLAVEAERAGSGPGSLVVQADRPGREQWELLLPPLEGILQAAPVTVDLRTGTAHDDVILRPLDLATGRDLPTQSGD